LVIYTLVSMGANIMFCRVIQTIFEADKISSYLFRAKLYGFWQIKFSERSGRGAADGGHSGNLAFSEILPEIVVSE